MKKIQLVKLDDHPDLLKIQEEIKKMDRKIKDWLLYISCSISIISYFTFSISNQNAIVCITSVVVLLLSLIPTAILGMRKFDQIVARYYIFRPENGYSEPQTAYEKYCIQICLLAKFVNEQIVEYNSLLVERDADQKIIELALVLETKKSYLEGLLSNLYRARASSFNIESLKTLLTDVEERVKAEQQARAVTAE